METYKTFIAVTAAALLLTGCAGTGMSVEQQQQQYQQSLAAAEAAYKKAMAVNYVWTNSGDLMKAAKEAAKKGELEKAISLAEQSREMSELAYNQYREQQDAGTKGIR